MRKPLHDYVLVRRDVADEKTKGGIVIPDQAQLKPNRGTVVAVGEKVPETFVKVGTSVDFSKFGGVDVPVSDYHPEGKTETLKLLRYSELLLVDVA